MWLGIIFFGMANAFILIPILLACKGPTRDAKIVKEMKLKRNRFQNMSMPDDPEIQQELGQLSIVEDSNKNTFKQYNQDMVIEMPQFAVDTNRSDIRKLIANQVTEEQEEDCAGYPWITPQ